MAYRAHHPKTSFAFSAFIRFNQFSHDQRPAEHLPPCGAENVALGIPSITDRHSLLTRRKRLRCAFRPTPARQQLTLSNIPLIGAVRDYPLFCKYKHKENNETTVTYECERKNPKQRLEELTVDENVFDLEQFETLPILILPNDNGLIAKH